MYYLYVVYKILFWITEINVIYYTFLFIVGLFFHKQKYPVLPDEKRFCIFVPCHNEGDVIFATVENFAEINYDKSLFDVFFIADNCTDDTAEQIEKAIEKIGLKNFNLLIRRETDPLKKGKPHALKWGIETLEKDSGFYDKYDEFMILDADNFVDADILKHINSQYLSYKENKRPAMIQVYLDCKNTKGIVARGYSVSYRVTGTFWQAAKQKLGLVPAVGGTGFAITTKFLRSIGGFNCNTLTEDLEIQTKATLKNQRIAYNSNARIYDEKPTGIKQSFVQRTRWSQGHWYLAFKFVPILFVQLFNLKTVKATFRKLDMITYLLSKFFILSAVIMLGIGAYFFVVGISPLLVSKPFVILGYVLTGLNLASIPLASIIGGTKTEKKRIFIDFLPSVISILLVSVIDVFALTVGLIKCGNQKVWKKTAHCVTVMPKSKNRAET